MFFTRGTPSLGVQLAVFGNASWTDRQRLKIADRSHASQSRSCATPSNNFRLKGRKKEEEVVLK